MPAEVFMKKKIGIIAIILVIAAVAAITVYAAGGYNSEEDPLVSLSYIEKIIMPKINTQLTELKNEIAKLKGEPVAPPTSATATATGTAEPEAEVYNYEVIKLTKGQTLLATTTLDIVVRSGDVVAVSPFTGDIKQGLNDYTDGTELLNGAAVPVNHFILVPRGNDGRGIKVTSDADTYVIVRGGYKIENAATVQ